MIYDLKNIDFSIRNNRWRIFRLKLKVIRMVFISHSFVFLNVKIDRARSKYEVDQLWRGMSYDDLHKVLCDCGQNCHDMASIDQELESIRKEIKI